MSDAGSPPSEAPLETDYHIEEVALRHARGTLYRAVRRADDSPVYVDVVACEGTEVADEALRRLDESADEAEAGELIIQDHGKPAPGEVYLAMPADAAAPAPDQIHSQFLNLLRERLSGPDGPPDSLASLVATPASRPSSLDRPGTPDSNKGAGSDRVDGSDADELAPTEHVDLENLGDDAANSDDDLPATEHVDLENVSDETPAPSSSVDEDEMAPTEHVDVEGVSDETPAPSDENLAATEHVDLEEAPGEASSPDGGAEPDPAEYAEDPIGSTDRGSAADSPADGTDTPAGSANGQPVQGAAADAEAERDAASPQSTDPNPAGPAPIPGDESETDDDRYKTGRWQDILRESFQEFSEDEEDDDEDDDEENIERWVAFAVVAGTVVGALFLLVLLVLGLVVVFG